VHWYPHWTPCDKDGKPLADDGSPAFRDGFVPLAATVHGSVTNTYSKDMRDYALAPDDNAPWWQNPYPHQTWIVGVYKPNEIEDAWVYDGETVGLGASSAYDNGDAAAYARARNRASDWWGWSIYSQFTLPTADGDPPASPEDINGDIDVTNVQVSAHAYFKWTPLYSAGPNSSPSDPPAGVSPPDAPEFASVWLKTHVFATAAVHYSTIIDSYPLVPLTGLSASATASADKYHETAAWGASDSIPPFYDSLSNGTQMVGGSHLVQAPVSGGIATVTLEGTSSAHAGNHFKAEASLAEAYGGVTGEAKIADMTLKADSTADTADWDSEHPRFFSGTNCTASGSIDVDKSLIDRAELTVECGGDTATIKYPDPAVPDQTPNLNITFDSTHGGDGQSIKITYRVWDKAADSPIEKTLSANAYNKAEAIHNNGVSNWSGLGSDVAVWLSDSNYTASSSDGLQKNDILGLLPNLTGLYIATHSFEGMFADCDISTPPPIPLNPFFILYAFSDPSSSQGGVAIATKVGTKGVDVPPYNFVFIDGCEASGDNSLADAFSVIDTDRAFLGWSNAYYIDQAHRRWVNDLWSNLDYGETLHDAVIDANIDSPVSGTNALSDIYGAVPAVPREFGDGAMRLHGVYRGSGNAWYR
jgi:hypothetical protein